MHRDIENLKSVLIETNAHDSDSAMNVLTGYFDHIGWSLAKSEWDRMTIKQRQALVTKLVSEITK